MNKQIKSIASILILIFLVQTVSASTIATIGMQGLSMASPEAGQIINNVICLSNPVGCLEGKVIGMVQSKALQALAEQSPEIAQAVMTYNQVQGYIDTGATIAQELKVNEQGQIEEGAIQFKDKEGRFGNLVGKDIKQDEIFGKEIQLKKEEGVSTISFTGENSYINVKGDLFKDIKTGDKTPAYIKLDESGKVTKADLTAEKDTSFVFNDKRIDIPKGTRIFYQDGKININGKEGEEVNLMDKVTDENGDYSFSNANKIKILNKNGRLLIEGNTIRGTDFQIGDLRVKAESVADLGEVSIVPEGYLLGKKSIGEWKGMSLMTDNNLLLATSKNNLDNYNSWVLPEEKRLRARGNGFEILFNEDNIWARVDSEDNFAIKAGEGFELDIQNRDSEGLIPKMEVGGEFAINQDYKSIYTENNKLLVKRDGTVFNSGAEKTDSTSPIELLVRNKEGNLNQEKYIVSNFKGIATVSLDASEAISDERYMNSIYSIRAKTDNRYNYPIIKDFESISGKKVEFLGEELNQPEYVRALIDIYESNPQNSFDGITKIKILDKDAYFAEERKRMMLFSGGFYNDDEKTFYVRAEDSFDREYGTIIHEMGHAIHYDIADYTNLKKVDDKIELQKNLINFLKEDYENNKLPRGQKEMYLTWVELLKDLEKEKIELETKILPIDSEWRNTLEVEYKDVGFAKRDGNTFYENGGHVTMWDTDNEEILKIFDFVNSKEEGEIYLEFPYKGFVKPYGASNLKEDIATYRQVVIGDPAFFKRYRLLDNTEGNIMYNSAYKQKIDLLLKYGFITDKEYDAVFHPEKYGLE